MGAAGDLHVGQFEGEIALPRVLSDELGDQYRSYMRRTKRLVPFVF